LHLDRKSHESFKCHECRHRRCTCDPPACRIRRRSRTDERGCARGPANRRYLYRALRGRVTNEAGAPLANVRVRVAIPLADMRFVDSTTPHKQFEAKTNTKGDYRLELPEITTPTTISIDAMKPGYRRLVGTLMSGGNAKSVEVAPGATAEASLILRSALYVAGVVVDEEGKPTRFTGFVSFTNSARSMATGT
jgi:hypothetical protein